jgi:hypothetical protein
VIRVLAETNAEKRTLLEAIRKIVMPDRPMLDGQPLIEAVKELKGKAS